ncbi:hypothetical protein FZC76_04695 [Sutcliffiella horikoshii]|uniref:Uncharacterized protein n=1 Tax=Sutcliffiella horikoshii TaxID=79883 RepID=A0A5D4T1I9_9BACI|nr:hypothetical protein [Sutcliffiella horikoshii]TYS69537.1 hypothetical protein FZC76_04695 [Sutcliffiella horikoshii]
MIVATIDIVDVIITVVMLLNNPFQFRIPENPNTPNINVIKAGNKTKIKGCIPAIKLSPLQEKEDIKNNIIQINEKKNDHKLIFSFTLRYPFKDILIELLILLNCLTMPNTVNATIS